MSKILGGSQTSETKLPEPIEKQMPVVIDKGNFVSEIGFAPLYGPDVAALSPLEEAAMRNTSNAASAFGMYTPQADPLAQINGTTAPVDPSQYQNVDAATAINNAYKTQLGRDPDAAGFDFWMQNYNPETFANDFAAGTRVDPLTGLAMPGTANGIRGYSSGAGFDNAVNELKQRRPGQHDALMAMFLNPQTGEQSQYQQQVQAQQQAAQQGLLNSNAFMPDYAGNTDPTGNGQQASFGGFADAFSGIGDAVGNVAGFFGGPSERW